MNFDLVDVVHFAYKVHRSQRRKYTNNPYTDHLSEVAGLVSLVSNKYPNWKEMIAVSWLHDSIEDQGVSKETLQKRFNLMVAEGVMLLSDLEVGTRKERKEASCTRLASAPGWIQTIKLADLISNTSSIVEHDPNFAVVYLAEKENLLSVLTLADSQLLEFAWQQHAFAQQCLDLYRATTNLKSIPIRPSYTSTSEVL